MKVPKGYKEWRAKVLKERLELAKIHDKDEGKTRVYIS